MSRVFLSHSHADKPFTRKLAAALRAAGHTVWIDEAEINIGDSLIEKIREGLDKVDHVVAVISSASVQSRWVTKELDIASNREIEEQRVVVLPLLLERVELPGFLKGKFYGDFTNENQFEHSLERLLRALGPVDAPPGADNEIEQLRREVASAREQIAQHVAAQRVIAKATMSRMSPGLIAAVEADNRLHPMYAPINWTYAFQMGDNIHVTLGYLLWGIRKAQREGAHVLDALLTIHDAWPKAERMIEAFEEYLSALPQE